MKLINLKDGMYVYLKRDEEKLRWELIDWSWSASSGFTLELSDPEGLIIEATLDEVKRVK